MSRRIRFRNYPKAQNPHYILLLWHNTGRTFLPFDFARQDVRFWAGERGNALTPHDPARRAAEGSLNDTYNPAFRMQPAGIAPEAVPEIWQPGRSPH